jgi:hypothetical protein
MATYATTLTATNISPLNEVERINGWNKKFTIPYTFLAASGATTATDVLTVTLGNTPDIWAVNAARAVVTTAFTATGTQGLTMIVGTTSSTSAFITSQSVLTVASLNQASTLPILTNATATAAVSIVATFTNAGAGSIAASTAGSVTILLNVENVGASGTYQPLLP